MYDRARGVSELYPDTRVNSAGPSICFRDPSLLPPWRPVSSATIWVHPVPVHSPLPQSFLFYVRAYPLLQRTIKARPQKERQSLYGNLCKDDLLLILPSSSAFYSLTATGSSYATTVTCLTWASSNQDARKNASHTQTRLPTHFRDSLIPLFYFLPPSSGDQIQGCALLRLCAVALPPGLRAQCCL